jgi:hypothetical protein
MPVSSQPSRVLPYFVASTTEVRRAAVVAEVDGPQVGQLEGQLAEVGGVRPEPGRHDLADDREVGGVDDVVLLEPQQVGRAAVGDLPHDAGRPVGDFEVGAAGRLLERRVGPVADLDEVAAGRLALLVEVARQALDGRG